MKLKLLFVTLILASFTFSCRQELDALGIHLDISQNQLSNGLVVVVIEDHSVPVVSYQTWYRVGSVDERPGITGISHFFEHLMFKGTEKFPDGEMFRKLESKGVVVNAFTMRDYTVFHHTLSPALLGDVIEIEADRMTGLKLNIETLEREKQVVLEERRMRTENQPGGRLQEALWALAYHIHPYRFPVVGFPDDLIDLSSDTIYQYYKKHYQPSNAVIVVVGDVNTAKVFEQIKSQYGKIPTVPAYKRDISSEPEQSEERRLTLYDEVASPEFAQAYHVTSARDDDSFALDVLCNILFVGKSSRGYRKLVDEKSLLMGVSGSNFTPLYPGLFMISGVMKKNSNSELVENELNALIKDIQQQGVTADEIKTAVRQLTVEMVDHVQTPDGVANLVGLVSMVYDDPKRFTEDLSKYQKVTSQDVQKVALKYLHPNNRSIVYMMPSPEEKK